MRRWTTGLGIALLWLGQSALAAWDESKLEGLEWREIGPFRGGRSAAAAYGNHPPNESAIAVRDELTAAIDAQLRQLEDVLGTQLQAFNQQVANLRIPAIAE